MVGDIIKKFHNRLNYHDFWSNMDDDCYALHDGADRREFPFY